MEQKAGKEKEKKKEKRRTRRKQGRGGKGREEMGCKWLCLSLFVTIAC
jgi:hypothetical protein